MRTRINKISSLCLALLAVGCANGSVPSSSSSTQDHSTSSTGAQHTTQLQSDQGGISSGGDHPTVSSNTPTTGAAASGNTTGTLLAQVPQLTPAQAQSVFGGLQGSLTAGSNSVIGALGSAAAGGIATNGSLSAGGVASTIGTSTTTTIVPTYLCGRAYQDGSYCSIGSTTTVVTVSSNSTAATKFTPALPTAAAVSAAAVATNGGSGTIGVNTGDWCQVTAVIGSQSVPVATPALEAFLSLNCPAP